MSLEEAFSKPIGGAPWERTDNPQAYDKLIETHVSTHRSRHELGLIGGNNVSIIKGNMIDLESDLRGITRINTHAPWRQYQAPTVGQNIVRSNWKNEVTINTQPVHLPTHQMWAYPVVLAPQPLIKETCGRVEKY
jgi:hypothetical protein